MLTDLILHGDIKAGEHLRENALCVSLGVSRNTVREAVRLLEQGGLVRHKFNSGATVITPSIDELADLYRARLHIESTAAAVKATPEQIARVRAAFDALSVEARGGDMREIVLCDLSFHASVVALLGSKRIDDFFAQILVELRFYLQVLSFEDREYDRPDALMLQHENIMTMIEAGDSLGAARAVSEHVKSNEERLTAILKAKASALLN